MRLDEARRNTVGSTYSKFSIEVFGFIQNHLIGVLLLMQKEQLFELSIGADGIPLGFYNRKKKKQTPRAAGEPYDMVFSGTLRDSIKIRITGSSIIFEADDKYVRRVRFDTIFGTKEWFGLSPDNLKKLIDEYVISTAIATVKAKVLTGQWIS